MPTIKGPITIKKGELAGFISDAVGGVKLPFKATGWKSTKGMDLIPDEYKKDSAKPKVKAQVSKNKKRLF